MPTTQTVLSWKPRVSVVLLVAAVVVLAAGADVENHLLNAREKASILAADGNVAPACFLINSYDCTSLNDSEGVTVCGQQSFPNCTGDCGSACSNTKVDSWACQSIANAGYNSCPNFQQMPMASCGFQTTGGGCAGVDKACTCINGINTKTKCSFANTQPNPLPPACPPAG